MAEAVIVSLRLEIPTRVSIAVRCEAVTDTVTVAPLTVTDPVSPAVGDDSLGGLRGRGRVKSELAWFCGAQRGRGECVGARSGGFAGDVGGLLAGG